MINSMLDESFCMSPQKNTNSKHNTLLYLNTTKKSFGRAVQALYEEKQRPNEATTTAGLPVCGIDFDPFEDQMLLAVADRMEYDVAKESHNRKISIAPSQGLKYEKLLRHKDEYIPIKTEVILRNSPRTPQKTKSIVELILEDFCSSPHSPEPADLHLQGKPTRQSSEDEELMFQFRNIPMRTYTRRSNTFPSFQKRLEEVDKKTAREDDSQSNCSCSDLSVQDDQTQIPYEEAMPKLSQSQRLQENLQNLSAYYSQISEGTIPTEGDLKNSQSAEVCATVLENKELEGVGASTRCLLLLEEVITLRRNFSMSLCGSLAVDSDFYGFSDDTNGDSCSTSNSCTINTLAPSMEINTDATMGLNAFDYASKISSTDSNNARLDDASLFFCDDRDDDFFINYATPKVSPNAKCTKKKSEKDHKNMPAIAFEKAQERIDKILEDFPELQQRNEKLSLTNSGPKHLGNQDIDFSNFQFSEWLLADQEKVYETSTSPVEADVSFQTASKKSIKVSKTALEKAATILTKEKEMQLDNAYCIEFQTRQKSSIDTASEIGEKNTTSKFTCEGSNERDSIVRLGFQTASNKNITVSEESKWKATGILTDLPPLSCDFEASSQEAPDMSKILNVDKKKQDPGNIAFLGFQTASRKTIKVSESSKRRAACILTDLPKVPTGNESFASNNLSPENMLVNKPESRPSKLNKTYAVERNGNDVIAKTALTKRKSFDDQNLLPLPVSKQTPIKENSCLRMVASDLVTNSPLSSKTIRPMQVISRRNLLSLSRVKKARNTGKYTHLGGRTESPVKNRSSENNEVKTPETPNFHDFFESVPTTSTPHMSRSETVKCRLQQTTSKSSDIDIDLIKIKWDTVRESSFSKPNHDARPLNTDKLSSRSVGNVKLAEANLTPKMHIERLNIYGKPPSISPIQNVNSNTCRPVGLRRALVKKYQ